MRRSIPKLSEDQIKQICRFTQIKYVKGDWQKWQAMAAFKWRHLKQLESKAK